MIISVDPKSPVPPFEQLRSQIATMVVTGVLRPGDRLPPIRQLAADLDLAAGTVSRAIRELERDGVIATKGRHGSFVVATATGLSEHRREEQLAALAKDFSLAVRQLGISPEVAVNAVTKALTALKE